MTIQLTRPLFYLVTETDEKGARTVKTAELERGAQFEVYVGPGDENVSPGQVWIQCPSPCSYMRLETGDYREIEGEKIG